ncbi:MAG: DUF4293 domain-containing protein [Niabella sp.]
MIQRKQTLWLLFSLVCAALMFKFPFYNGTVKAGAIGVEGAELTATDNIWLLLLSGCVTAVALIAVFMYKNRKLQFRLSFIGLALSIGQIALFYYYSRSFDTGGIALSALITLGTVAGFFFALKGIRNDQKLIRDLNRLR